MLKIIVIEVIETERRSIFFDIIFITNYDIISYYTYMNYEF